MEKSLDKFEEKNSESTQEVFKPNFPNRPPVSKKFQPKKITLVSNHFSLELSKKQEKVYIYSVKIVDQSENDIMADNRSLISNIFMSIRDKIKETFGLVFQAGFNLWSLRNTKDIKTYEVNLSGSKYFVKISKSKEVSLKQESLGNLEEAAQVRQFLNIMIKKYLRGHKFVEWGNNAKYYHPDRTVDLRKQKDLPIELWFGYKTSCEVYDNLSLKVLIDFSCRILRTDSVLDFIKGFRDQEEIRDNLIGCSVVTNYGNYRMYKVHDIDFKKNPSHCFKDMNGQQISIADYFKKEYNVDIKDKKQPLIVNFPRKGKNKGKEIYLVPELLRMTGLTDQMRGDFHTMRDIAEYTRLNPSDRMKEISDLADPLSAELEKDFGVVMKKSNEVTGYLLDPPHILTGKGEIIPEKGNFQFREPVFKPSSFLRWILAYPKACEESAQQLLETLKKCSAAYGIKVGDPIKVEIASKNPNDLKAALRQKCTPETQIVVCIFPPPAKSTWYPALKQVCGFEIGVPCQAVVTKSLEKNTMAVASKILIQMNVKSGQAPWCVKQPEGLPERSMIIGADVYHRFDKKNNSCVGFCASMDPNFSKFYSKICIQKQGKELMENIGELVKKAVEKYFIYNGKKYLPEYIFFYRDGVSDGHIPQILEFETNSILHGLSTLGDGNYKPKFAEIIVTKRIDDRIFSMNANKTQIFNPPAGTLVAQGITSNHFDFLLTAQNVTQGTCTPTRYNVIYDTTGLPAEVFYQMTFYQCYNYYNWSGGIRVPSVVMYAHKLAYLIGQTVKSDINSKLEDSLSLHFM